MFENEIWKDVPGYEGKYQAGSNGNIRSFVGKGRPRIADWEGFLLKQYNHKQGYLSVRLEGKGFLVHRLVLAAFSGKFEDLDCNHKNGNKRDNRIENLEYCTRSENNLHAFRVLKRKAVSNKGEKHGMAKLTEDKVREIRSLYNTGEYSQTKISKIFNVHVTNISLIVKRKHWKHI